MGRERVKSLWMGASGVGMIINGEQEDKLLAKKGRLPAIVKNEIKTNSNYFNLFLRNSNYTYTNVIEISLRSKYFIISACQTTETHAQLSNYVICWLLKTNSYGNIIDKKNILLLIK